MFLASAEPVDPRQLPAPFRPRSLPRRMVATARHAWVLHRRALKLAMAGVVVLAAGVGLYEARDHISTGLASATDLVQGRFASAGFGINAIEISGQRLTRERDIFALLTMGNGNSTLTYDVDKARMRLEWLQAVESASVRKVYPDRLEVAIVEREPVARWRVAGVTYLVDVQGRRIGTTDGAFGELPLVIGSGAADDAQVMIRALAQHPDLKAGIAALSRISDRRWDLIFQTGLRVQLPEQGVAQALVQLAQYQRDYRLLDRDVTVIDLRVPGLVALEPGEDAAAQIEAERKAAGKKRS
ncbi:cell division protein FtsQ/DivIB [Devosia enhydra]|uniref:cell division protein FtsQ/DivIB n=1 Tax=Devosia enhydra TaxID=665118 RepID=UPI001160772F|nr:cell division protein FtsQ/DivIB [Devosia enhydra]